jgi:hypothetical protein
MMKTHFSRVLCIIMDLTQFERIKMEQKQERYGLLKM